jgi:multidrug efflux system membrane fusion protein
VESRLRTGAKLSVDAFDRTALKKIETGELLTLNNQIDTTTGTVKARASFENKSGALFPNQFVNTRLLVNTLQGVTLVPASAIQQNGTKSFVYVIQNGVAHMRNITVGVSNAGITQATGLNPGEVVANSSFDKLKDNVAVAVTPNPPPAAAAPATAGAPPAPAGTTPTATGDKPAQAQSNSAATGAKK